MDENRGRYPPRRLFRLPNHETRLIPTSPVCSLQHGLSYRVLKVGPFVNLATCALRKSTRVACLTVNVPLGYVNCRRGSRTKC